MIVLEKKTKEILLKSQLRFRSKKHNVFTEEVNKTALSTNDDKRIQSIDSIETYAYGTRRNLVCKKEKIKYIYIKNNTKMIHYDDVTKENIKQYNPNWPEIPDHPYRILIIWVLNLEKQTHCLI